MERVTIESWVIDFDRTATVAAYEAVSVGSAEDCGCAECENWMVQRVHAYPSRFSQLLMTLGIDQRKETDVTGWEGGVAYPGSNRYTGEFAFVGQLVSGPEYYVPALGGGYNFHHVELEPGFNVGFANEAVHVCAAHDAFKSFTPVCKVFFETRVAYPAEVLSYDYSEELEELFPSEARRCTGCGSVNVEVLQSGRKAAFLMFWLVRFPLWRTRRLLRCKDCGAITERDQ